MSPKELYDTVHLFCIENKNEENLKKYSRYFKGGYNGFGLGQKEIQDKVKELKNNEQITHDLIIKAAPLFIKSDKYEEPVFILLLLNERKKFFSLNTLDEIEKWYSYGINNWAHADGLGMYILPHFLIENIAGIERFKPWLEAQNSFQRRSVPVTFIKYIKTKECDFSSLFRFLEVLMQDGAREVHQGMGWFLREAWKIKPEETEEFLMRWKNSAPRLIFQYACEKMGAEEKLRFKKEK